MSPRHRSLATLAAALTAALAVTIAGCSTAVSPAAADATATSPSPVSIVDHTGNEVTIPSKIERVAMDEIPLASTYLAFFHGDAPHLAGMSASVVDSLRDTVVADMAPQVLDVDSSYYDNGELNVESLLTIRPDVVFYNANNTKHADMFAKAGIPAVGFSTTGDPATVYVDWLKLLEKVFQAPSKMDAVIASGQKLIDNTKKRVASIADGDKASVLIVYNYASGTLRVAGDTPFFGYYWLQTVNAGNAAVGTDQGLAPVSGEQVLAWDPDMILIGGSGPAGITPQQIIDGTVDGLDLSALRAVKEGKVYSNGLGMWSWFTPNPDAPLITEWLGKVIYPDAFADVDLAADTKAYYEEMYGYALSDSQVEAIFQGTPADA